MIERFVVLTCLLLNTHQVLSEFRLHFIKNLQLLRHIKHILVCAMWYLFRKNKKFSVHLLLMDISFYNPLKWINEIDIEESRVSVYIIYKININACIQNVFHLLLLTQESIVLRTNLTLT